MSRSLYMFIDTDSTSIQMYWNCLLFLLQQHLLFKTYNHASMNLAFHANETYSLTWFIPNNIKTCSFHHVNFTKVIKIFEKIVKKKKIMVVIHWTYFVGTGRNCLYKAITMCTASIRKLPSAPTICDAEKI